MKHIYLKGFTPELVDDVIVELSSFPSGCEEHVRIKGSVADEDVTIVAGVQSSADIMQAFLATDAARRAGATSVSLFMPYLPYARQDRVCNTGEALSAHVIATLINAQGYARVEALDVHSDVLPALINNFRQRPFFGHARAALNEFPYAVLCAPDAGAMKRTEATAKTIGYLGDILCATKKREGGRILTESLIGDCDGRDVIIVDDICDGGGTFVALGKKLKEQGAKSVILCVTHGLFTRGARALMPPIDRIFTTNSYVLANIDENLITRISI